MKDLQADRVFDVAFSFASVQRDYVEKVKNELLKYDVSVFYDNDYVADLWGKNLYTYLAEIYSKKASYCVIFISKEYAERPWTIHESQFAMERVFYDYAKEDMQEYILPVKFDDTILPGLPISIGCLDARRESPEKVAEYIAQKVAGRKGSNYSKIDVFLLFEHLKMKFNVYNDEYISMQLNANEDIVTIIFTKSDNIKNMITFHLIEKYIYLYLGEFLAGINPSAVIYIDKTSNPKPIKIINFSLFFTQSPEYNIELRKFDEFLNAIIRYMAEGAI